MKNRILIVDDESDIVNLLKDHFEYSGYEVLIAECGEEAIKKSEQQRICGISFCSSSGGRIKVRHNALPPRKYRQWQHPCGGRQRLSVDDKITGK